MSTITMRTYGEDLSGREFGKQTFKEINDEYEPIISLDFEHVGSIGSSFADEVVVKIAQKQENRIIISNANRVIKSCLNDVADEKNLEISYEQ